MKTKFVSDLQVGEEIHGISFAVKKVETRTAVNGNAFKSLILSDKTGEINAKIWQTNFKNCGLFEVGEAVSVDGLVEDFKGAKSIRVNNLEALDSNQIDSADFLKVTSKDVTELFSVVEKTCKSVKNKFLKKLLNNFFGNEDFVAKFKRAPGAEFIHHASLGGLLEHTVEMLNYAEPIIENYPNLNADLLKTAILLHDIGKMLELQVSMAVSRTVVGQLHGHLILSEKMVSEALAAIKGFPEELRLELIHLILSHHGFLEYGSPVKPMMTEAWALHLLDLMSARMNTAYYQTIVAKEKGETFSAKVFALDSRLYVPNSSDESDEPSTLF